MINYLLDHRWKLTVKVIPIVFLVILIKFVVHSLEYEFLSLSPLFTAIISANIFLIGFLISGVLVDYKESEKIPGDLATSLEAIYDETSIIYANKKAKEAKDFQIYLRDTTISVIKWFYKKERTKTLQDKITGFNKFFLAFEPLTQANFIVRMKQEQNNIRKMITRIHTIKETSFNEGGYAIAEIITFMLVLGIIVIKIDPFYESIFFVAFVSFILIYMIMLIKDLDNPFNYKTYRRENTDEVSLKPLEDLKDKLNQ